MIPLLVLVWFHINGSDLQCFKLGLLGSILHRTIKKNLKKSLHFIFFFFSACLPSGEDGSESHAETPGSETSRESHSYQTFTNTALKVLGGLLMVLCISSSWVGTTQVVKLTYQSFSCPFFISWFSSNWNILFFPIYYSGHVVLTREKQTPIQKFR